MVAITHMSNVLGTVVPIKEVISVAHARGIPVLVDGSQAAVHMPVDVQDLDCDFYVFTGHKTYGPTGIGVLYAKQAAPRRHAALPGRRRHDRERAQRRITYGKPPHKFEAGTPPIVQAIGLGAALNYMMQVGRERIAAPRGRAARTTRTRGSRELNWLKIYGTRQGQGRHRLVHASTACTRTTSPPSSTARAWRCAPATTAPSR